MTDKLMEREVIQQHDRDVIALEKIYDLGVTARKDADRGRFTIGDLGLLITTHYRGHDIEDFAKHIGVGFKSIYEYMGVCEYYELLARTEFLDAHPNVTYSHLRQAKRMKDIDLSYGVLEQANDEQWTVDQTIRKVTEIIGKPVPPTKRIDSRALIVGRSIGNDQQVVFEFPLDISDKLAKMKLVGESAVRVVIYLEGKVAL